MTHYIENMRFTFPFDCLGNIPVLSCSKNGIPIIGVKENSTIQSLEASSLGLTNFLEVDNYLEAAGVLSALKAGLSIESLRRPISSVTTID